MWIEDTTIEQALTKIFGDDYSVCHVSSGLFEERKATAIQDILVVCTPYDYFLLEEEGRLSDTIRSLFLKREVDVLPKITQVDSGRQALNLLKQKSTDLVVLFNMPRDMDAADLAQQIHENYDHIPVVLLANNTKELQRFTSSEKACVFDWIFTWQGDGTIFVSIINCVEDMLHVQQQKPCFGERYILLVDDKVQQYSSLLPVLYEGIWKHLDDVLQEHLPLRQRAQRVHRRPRVLLVRTKQEIEKWLLSSHRFLCCILGDHHVLSSHKKDINQANIPLLTYDPAVKPGKRQPVSSKDPLFLSLIHEFLQQHLGVYELLFLDVQGREKAKAHDLISLEKALWSIPDDVFLYSAEKKIMQHWLISRTESELAEEFDKVITDGFSKKPNDVESLRKHLISTLVDHKHRIHQGAVTAYHRGGYGSHLRFTRIGTGALGGKARGLAFMDKLLATYLPDTLFEGVTIGIPRTLVLCTDVFDEFIDQNQLLDKINPDMSDDRIASLFMESSLPSTVLGDLRDFCKEMDSPLAVRSSSLLEDALFQPFAGVYASLMLPNSSLEVDARFRDLCNAVKFIYASVFFQKAREYIRTTPQQVIDEKMGIVIQEVIGQRHDAVFYPTVSGVARSYNYYPVGRCKGEDGIAHLALGMGTQIVDGGRSFRFCPAYPMIPHYSSLDDTLKNSQTTFFAIDLQTRISISHQHEDATFKQLDLATAESHGSLNYIASTFHAGDQKLYAGLGAEGPRVLDFQPLLHQRNLPLAKIIQAFLAMGEISLGSPVEIEFALNIDPDTFTPAHIALLQVRSMVAGGETEEVSIDDISKNILLCYSQHALGHGVYSSIHDLVYVAPDTFDLAITPQIVPELNKINQQLVKEQRPYVLVGPGRWGSQDPWLGIPVVWSDIGGAKIIVETPVEERVIEPSEGSHFFQNMSSLRVGYLTVLPNQDDFFSYEQLSSIPPTQEAAHVKHLRFKQPLDIRINGKTREAVIAFPPKGKTKG